MAATGHGATFTFVSDRGTYRGGVTNVNVETPAAEIADMTDISAPEDRVVLVPTRAWKGGSVSVDFIASTQTISVESLVRGYGQLTFVSPGISVSKQVILESASSSVTVGDVVKGSMKFVPTDFYG